MILTLQQQLFLSPLINLAINQSYENPRPLAESPCPFLGQIYPPPTNIALSPTWQDAISEVNDAYSAWPLLEQNTTSYAIQVVSLHDHSPIFEHYNKAPDHIHGKDGTASVNGDSMFRIASVSKLFTVYALLLKCGFKCFEDPISKYIPELAHHTVDDPITAMEWDEVTVGALASQISGLGRDYAIGDNAANGFLTPGSQYGLPDPPNLDPADIPSCGANIGQPACNREESIKLMLKHAPNFPTWYTPAYSNMAYQLLGYVLENITGQTYEEVLTESVFQPLHLKHTTASVPNNLTDLVIMPGDSNADWDFGDDTPTGGIYSSTSDLAKHALALLNHTQLTPSQTRRWMKPHSHTSDVHVSIGAPWEIGRVPGLSTYHTIDVYTKSGSLITYTTQYGIIPELQVAYAVNSLSLEPFAAAGILAGVVLQHTLKPLFDIAKAQALTRFGGTYVDDRPGVNSKITITTDEEIGLVISTFISNGTDFLQLLASLGVTSQPVRLFPTTLNSKTHGGAGDMAFRAAIFTPMGQCVSWATVDGFRWGGIGLDLVMFEVEDLVDGGADAVRLPAFRARYRRVEESLQVQ